MFELPLHTGTDHPSLTLLVLSSLVTFVAGLGVGTFAGRIRGVVSELASERSE